MQKFDVGQVEEAVAYFDRWGYVVFRNAIAPGLAERFWASVEDAIRSNDDLTYTLYGEFFSGPNVPLDGKKLPRIVDVESHVPEARALMLSPVVSDFLTAWYKGVAPTCLQTLTYKYSSEQGAHSDKRLVAPPQSHDYDRETLVASWFALEPSNVENGALIVYPGSHRVPKPTLTWELKYDYAAYVAAMDKLARDAGCEPVAFEADAGDVLFWHSDFVHAGGPILGSGGGGAGGEPPTRKSLVCHYARLRRWTRSRDGVHQRVRAGGGSYFHKRAFLPPHRERWFDRFLSGPRLD